MKEFKLAPPWITYTNELKAMFRNDPEVNVVYNNDAKEVKLYVEKQDKAEALMMLLPKTKEFGGVKLKVTVVPANGDIDKEAIFRRAFEGNPAFSDAVTLTGVFNNPITFVVFNPEVVQFWNDNMGDAYGNWNGLMEDVARDVFGDQDGVYYSTSLIETHEGMPVAKPGEWLEDKEE